MRLPSDFEKKICFLERGKEGEEGERERQRETSS